MGEQFIDLFTAGAYALCSRIYSAIADPSFAWLFYLLATAGIVFAIMEAAVEQRPEYWLRHMLAVCLASVLTLLPQRVDITLLTYGAPGQIEQIFGTRTGSAPQITYWIERLGAGAASALQSLTHQPAFLAIPGVAIQVEDITSDPACVNDPQLKANLEIWRRRVVPQLLSSNPGLAQQIRGAGLESALASPIPPSAQFVGSAAANRSQAVRSMLAQSGVDLRGLVDLHSASMNQIAHDAGASAWVAQGDGPGIVAISFASAPPGISARRLATAAPAFDDAIARGDAVLGEMRSQFPGGADPLPVSTPDQLYDLLGRSVLYAAGSRLSHDEPAKAAIGSLCQRGGDTVCRSAMAPVYGASAKLRVVDSDRYNSDSWTTWLQQPVATTLLTLTSLMLSTLAALVVSVLPFALGVAKAMAILISMMGAWLLLWPGRARIALSWMVGPISFVSLWGVLFNFWSDIEPSLVQVAAAVGDSQEGSFSARRLMSIAISLGYMGLPSLALGIVYGESGRALYHASARLETALLMAWHTRGSIAAFGRRWVVNSPLVRRWNQRAYRAVGMGPLRAQKSGASGGKAKSGFTRGAVPRSGTGSRAKRGATASATPDLFSAASTAQAAASARPRRTAAKRPLPPADPPPEAR